MAGEPSTFANRWKRFSDWDERPLRLDKFAIEDAENGFASFTSRHDPKSGLTLGPAGIAVMDGVGVGDFDMIDTFIARYHIDPVIAPEAMAMPSSEVARITPAWWKRASTAVSDPASAAVWELAAR